MKLFLLYPSKHLPETLQAKYSCLVHGKKREGKGGEGREGEGKERKGSGGEKKSKAKEVFSFNMLDLPQKLPWDLYLGGYKDE